MTVGLRVRYDEEIYCNVYHILISLNKHPQVFQIIFLSGNI